MVRNALLGKRTSVNRLNRLSARCMAEVAITAHDSAYSELAEVTSPAEHS